MKFIACVIAILALTNPAIGASKLDSLEKEYVQKLNSICDEYILTQERMQACLRKGRIDCLDEDQPRANNLMNAHSALKLDALKYYKGKPSKKFSNELKKVEDRYNNYFDGLTNNTKAQTP